MQHPKKETITKTPKDTFLPQLHFLNLKNVLFFHKQYIRQTF